MASARTVTEPSELLPYLFLAWPETKKKQVREWLKFGAVAVNGKVITQFNHRLKPGDQVSIRPRGHAAPDTALPGGIRIRHEDADLLVIEKPAGLLSIASPSESEKTAYADLTEHVRQGSRLSRARVWIVHAGWEAVEKKYLAVVEGAPQGAAGLLDSHLDESNPLKVYSDKEGPATRRALTRYRVMKKGTTTTLVELTLETGRRHQIRVQLADAGCPIVGDKKYGAATNPLRRIALHACGLRLLHPVTREVMRFYSPLPGDLGTLV
jgi:23S rRNA pseudouridine1911/1915/1917 synthase